MKLGKRVADLEAREIGAAPKKFHLLELDQGQTLEEAKDEYGRDLIGPDDICMMIVGFSEVDGDDPVDSTHS